MLNAAKIERGGLPLGSYFDVRLAQFRAHRFEPSREVFFRKRETLLYELSDDETSRRDALPDLSPRIKGVRIDKDGFLYTTSWRIAAVANDYELLGQRAQLGRNYEQNPPKTKEPRRLVFPKHKKGIDVMLRGMWEVAEKYLHTNDSPGREAWQYAGIVHAADQMQQDLVNFRFLTDLQVNEALQRQAATIDQFRLDHARTKEKIAWKQTLEKGYTDRNGRKNALALMMRLFSVSVNLVRQEQKNFKAYNKYAGFAVSVSFLRDDVRFQVERGADVLANLLQSQPFQNPDFSKKPPSLQQKYAHALTLTLTRLGNDLGFEIPVHPYNLAVGVVVRNFGTITDEGGFKFPKGSINEKMWKQRQEMNKPSLKGLRLATDAEIPKDIKDKLMAELIAQKAPTIADYLAVYDFGQAGALIERCRQILELVLRKNADYMNLKKSENIKRDRKVPQDSVNF